MERVFIIYISFDRKGRAMNILNDEKVIVILTDGMDPAVIKHIDKAQKFYDQAASTLNGNAVIPAITASACSIAVFA